MSSEYAATRKQFGKSLSEFGLIQVRSPLADRFLWLQKPAACFCLRAAAGEVCRHGSECFCDGEHGLPDRRDDGPARSPRLFPRGRHGQGAKVQLLLP